MNAGRTIQESWLAGQVSVRAMLPIEIPSEMWHSEPRSNWLPVAHSVMLQMLCASPLPFRVFRSDCHIQSHPFKIFSHSHSPRLA